MVEIFEIGQGGTVAGSMSFCPFCGARMVVADQSFCVSCGRSLARGGAAQPASVKQVDIPTTPIRAPVPPVRPEFLLVWLRENRGRSTVEALRDGLLAAGPRVGRG